MSEPMRAPRGDEAEGAKTKKPAGARPGASKKKRKKGTKRGAPESAARAPWWLAGVGAVGLLGFTLWAWAPREAPEPHVARGNEHYRGRRFDEALGEYEAAPGNGPRFAGVHMDRGLARYRIAAPTDGGSFPLMARDASVPDAYSQAQEELRTAARGGSTGAAEDVSASLRARAAYNLGNTHFTARQWDAAIDSYKEALRLRPGWREAAWNLELARRLKELERNPPDAGQPDASRPDGAPPDSSSPDSGSPDSSSPDSGSPDGGQGDAAMDSGGGDGGPRNGDGGNNADGSNPNASPDAGSAANDAGPSTQPDAAAQPADAAAPRSLGPLDELDRSSRSLQNEMLRRRGVTPAGPDDDR